MSDKPLFPRVTKSTAVSTIKLIFPKISDLLKRFEMSKKWANQWDGERDGLREAVKLVESGQYDNVMIQWTPSGAVCYVNAEGKHYLENTLQTDIPAIVAPGAPVLVLLEVCKSPEEFLDRILSLNRTSKVHALEQITKAWVGTGFAIENKTLYKKEPGERAKITVLGEPEPTKILTWEHVDKLREALTEAYVKLGVPDAEAKVYQMLLPDEGTEDDAI